MAVIWVEDMIEKIKEQAANITKSDKESIY